MNIQILIAPIVVGIPGFIWFVLQYRKYQETDEDHKPRWQLFKLILSILLFIVVSGLASVLFIMPMLGHGAPAADVLKFMGGAVLLYVATFFILGQWIKSTRLGNISVSLAVAAGVLYLVTVNPVLFVKPLADKNIATAQYLMGFLYEKGIGGVPKNKGEAGRWYVKAAKQGLMSAARSHMRLFPKARNMDILTMLAADNPDGDVYFALWEATFKRVYPSELEKEADADKWLSLAADLGHPGAIVSYRGKHYSLSSSCRISPKSYEALPKFEKWLKAYGNHRDEPDFQEHLYLEWEEQINCLAEKVEEAKRLDAELGPLTKKIFSSNNITQSNAIHALRGMGPRAYSAIPNLLLLAQSRNFAPAQHALSALKDIDPEGEIVAKALIAMLNNPSPHIRANAAYGLGLYSRELPDAIPLLDKLLEDTNHNVAGRAALALAEFGYLARGSLEKIAKLKESRIRTVRSYARQAYNKIRQARKQIRPSGSTYTIRY